MNDNNNMTTLPKRGLKTRSYNMDMSKKDLKRLSKLLLKQEAQKPSNSVNEHEEIIKPIPPPRTGKWESVKPKPVPRKSVNEDIILPPKQFRDRPPKPTRKPPPVPQVEEKEHQASLITNVPSSKIRELNQALKGHAKSYGTELQDSLNPLTISQRLKHWLNHI